MDTFPFPVLLYILSMQDLFVQWHGHSRCLTAPYTYKPKQAATVQLTAANILVCQDIRWDICAQEKGGGG